MLIIYGGIKEVVEKQLQCEHKEFNGPFMDDISRYYKCANCKCLLYDCDWDNYQRLCSYKEKK